MKYYSSYWVLLCGLGLLLGGMAYKKAALAHNGDEPSPLSGEHPSSLNVRLSSRTIHPPQELIKQVIPLQGIRAARPRVGPPPQAAIIEDDQRRRMVILSTGETGLITAYVLEDLDLKPHLFEVAQCSEEHHCGEDRMAVTGGLGCVAICVKNVLEKLIQP